VIARICAVHRFVEKIGDIMSATFPPSREAELLTFSLNFKTKITATPTTFGLTAGQATAYGTLHTAFASAYAVAQDEATRSPMNVELKNVAKTNLVANLRLLAGIVQRAPGTTNAMRLDLGLPQRDSEPTPIPAPANAPQVAVKSVSGLTAKIRLIDIENPTRRGKPAGVIGASIFSFVGEESPAELSAWKFEGNTGHTSFDVVFPSTTAAGAKVWFTCFWFNPSKRSGPASAPISANMPGGSVSTLAA
jgi:hypothetical protein